MPDEPYNLADLARLAGVTPRTVRYYVAQGLLPSPEAAGPATRYGEGHLARLRLIRRLQRSHQPLAGIRNRLGRMDDAAVGAALDLAEPGEPDLPAEPGDTLAFVRELMAKAGIPSAAAPTPTAPTPAAPSPASAAPAPARRHPLLSAMRIDLEAPPAKPATPVTPGSIVFAIPVPEPAKSAPLAGPDRSTWERLAITPDVEIHVRRPLDRRSNKRVEQLTRIARELFEDESQA